MVTETRTGMISGTEVGRGFTQYDVDRGPIVSRKTLGWSPIIAGTGAALSIQAILTFLGIGIGAAAVDPATQVDPTKGLGAGAVVWAILTGLIAYGLGGYFAGALSRPGGHVCGGGVHGMFSWALAGVIGMTITALSGAAILGGTASNPAAASRAAMATSDTGLSNSNGSLGSTIYGSGVVGKTGDQSATTSPSSTATNRTIAGVNEVDARVAAEKATRATSRFALFSALALFMGLVGGTVGGAIGRKYPPVVDPTVDNAA